jgi:hypothetical protein
MTVVRYTREDLALFSKASHDNSRLHMCDDYARQTSYGEPIVFGVLGVFASLGALADQQGKQLAGAAVDYRVAFYMDVDYQIEVKAQESGAARVHLKDGKRTLMTSNFTFRDEVDLDSDTPFQGTAPLLTQSTWTPDRLREGVQVEGNYAPAPGPLRALIERWNLARKGVSLPQIGVFLWSSYLTGMHVPGLLGTSARLEVSYVSEGTTAEIPFKYNARVSEFDDRFSLLRTSTELSGRRGTFGTAEVTSHVREVSL